MTDKPKDSCCGGECGKIPVYYDMEPYEGAMPMRYNGYAYIIEQNDEGNRVFFQSGGSECNNRFITGLVMDRFKQDMFTPDCWIGLTDWCDDYPEAVFIKPDSMPYPNDESEWHKAVELANQRATTTEYLVGKILERISEATGVDYKFPFPDTAYGKYWEEAFVPLSLNGNEKYILTWQNSD